jgi:short-subunit dehydrogenase
VADLGHTRDLPAIGAAIAARGEYDILVNAAGINLRQPFELGDAVTV